VDLLLVLIELFSLGVTAEWLQKHFLTRSALRIIGAIQIIVSIYLSIYLLSTSENRSKTRDFAPVRSV